MDMTECGGTRPDGYKFKGGVDKKSLADKEKKHIDDLKLKKGDTVVLALIGETFKIGSISYAGRRPKVTNEQGKEVSILQIRRLPVEA